VHSLGLIMSVPHATIQLLTQQERRTMLATAIKIQQATSESVVDNEVMESARAMAWELAEGSTDKLDRIAELLFQYSAILAGTTATKVTYAIMENSEFNNMVNELRELDELSQQIQGENN